MALDSWNNIYFGLLIFLKNRWFIADNNDELFLRNGWPTTKIRDNYQRSSPSRIFGTPPAGLEPEFRLSWIKFCSNDTHFITTSHYFLKSSSLIYIIFSFLLQSYKITELQPLWISVLFVIISFEARKSGKTTTTKQKNKSWKKHHIYICLCVSGFTAPGPLSP